MILFWFYPKLNSKIFFFDYLRCAFKYFFILFFLIKNLVRDAQSFIFFQKKTLVVIHSFIKKILFLIFRCEIIKLVLYNNFFEKYFLKYFSKVAYCKSISNLIFKSYLFFTKINKRKILWQQKRKQQKLRQSQKLRQRLRKERNNLTFSHLQKNSNESRNFFVFYVIIPVYGIFR